MYMEWWLREGRRARAWLIAGVWQLKRVRRHTDKGR